MTRDIYKGGDRVAFDGNRGTVIGAVPAVRSNGQDYWVRWDNDMITKVWGSDLMPDGNDDDN